MCGCGCHFGPLNYGIVKLVGDLDEWRDWSGRPRGRFENIHVVFVIPTCLLLLLLHQLHDGCGEVGRRCHVFGLVGRKVGLDEDPLVGLSGS